MSFTYNADKLGKKSYNLFLAPFSDITKTMLASDDIEFMSKFRVNGVEQILSGNKTIDNTSLSALAFYNTTSSTVTVSATDSKPRFVINLGTSTVVIGALTLNANEIAIVPCGGVVNPFKTPYLPVGICEAGISFSTTKGDVKNLSTGEEAVISENVEMSANVFGAREWLKDTLVNRLCSIGMVEVGVEAGIFIKSIYPNTELNFVSNDQNITKVFVKAEIPTLELVG